jgi:hypothetical protein
MLALMCHVPVRLCVRAAHPGPCQKYCHMIILLWDTRYRNCTFLCVTMCDIVLRNLNMLPAVWLMVEPFEWHEACLRKRLQLL